jgi:hypothetical protein
VATSGLITILLTDPVGSTALASAVGDPAADEMRRGHLAALREGIGAEPGMAGPFGVVLRAATCSRRSTPGR